MTSSTAISHLGLRSSPPLSLPSREYIFRVVPLPLSFAYQQTTSSANLAPSHTLSLFHTRSLIQTKSTCLPSTPSTSDSPSPLQPSPPSTWAELSRSLPSSSQSSTTADYRLRPLLEQRESW